MAKFFLRKQKREELPPVSLEELIQLWKDQVIEEVQELVVREMDKGFDDLIDTVFQEQRHRDQEANQIRKEMLAGVQTEEEQKAKLIPIVQSLIPAAKEALPGIPGPKGDAPTREELVRLILPLIPEPIPGEQGLPGIGIKGDSGSPDTPDQVISKIHKSKEKIAQAKIEGLEEQIRLLKQAIREKQRGGGGGGGMGNVTHERKAVSSATTTVTADYKIAGEGNALWLRYQGQMLFPGTQFTVGGDYKTITLLFTPQDNKSIDLTYIRS